MGRFTKVKKDNQEVERYTYDNNGNRVSATVNGTSITASYTLDDNLVVYGDNSYLYDDDGYLKEKTTPQGTTTYTYGTRGELLSVTTPTKTITYKHNALNQRVAKLVNGQVVEKYLWKDLTTLLAIYDANDNLKQRFEYADSRMPISMTSNGQKYYLHYDQVGSLRAVSDANGNVVKAIAYDTFGNILNDSNPDFTVPFGFAGGLYDPLTKLTHFGFREYDSFTGKWTAKDPIGFAGGDSNLYGYVLGDPVGGFDPLGLLWGDEAGEDALNYWINKQITTGNYGYYVPAFFAALWTLDTSEDTAETLSLCIGGAWYKTGKEISFGKNLRVAPFGKRTGHPTGKYPHYHRRSQPNSKGQVPRGQGIKRHRPWDKSGDDKSFWNRF